MSGAVEGYVVAILVVVSASGRPRVLNGPAIVQAAGRGTEVRARSETACPVELSLDQPGPPGWPGSPGPPEWPEWPEWPERPARDCSRAQTCNFYSGMLGIFIEQ